ncbi:MAG TPA: hypothetical protein VK158_01920 [Acidobacteriota bacterium]|nr:hypothetical protein [Acidobacteriota bacterium]
MVKMSRGELRRTVGLIILLVVMIAITFLFIAVNKIRDEGDDKAFCQVVGIKSEFQNRISDFTDMRSVLGNPTYEFSCPATFTYVTYDSVSRLSTAAKNKALREGIPESQLSTPTGAIQYNLDALFADEVIDCWQKTGNVDLFDSYYKLSSDEINKQQSGFFGKLWNALADYALGVPQVESPRFCAMCAKVQFDKQTIAALGTDASKLRSVNHIIEKRKILGATENNALETITHGLPVEVGLGNSFVRSYTVDQPQAVIYFKKYPLKYTYDEKVVNVIKETGRWVITVIPFTAPLGVLSKASALLRLSGKALTTAGKEKIGLEVGRLATAVYSRFGAKTAIRWELAAFPLSMSKTQTAAFIAAATASSEAKFALYSHFLQLNPSEETYSVMIIPYQQVSYYCDVLANSYARP